ncbi:MAG: glutathione peroxidase [Pseudomonadaceae bacterium]|nr:MAG: glutathione peroxidase [Pseudomonadaceae bacterium]
MADCPEILQHEVQALRSNDQVNLCERYAGKPLLVVNTASFCGYTGQFEGLQALYETYSDQGLAILGVPSNDFRQEARDQEAIADVCYVNYGVTFQMTEPLALTGPGAHPFYRQLVGAAGEAPRWNFHKYLLDADGQVVGSFPSRVAPESSTLRTAIEQVLAP